jgi:hypothetical protein
MPGFLLEPEEEALVTVSVLVMAESIKRIKHY